ncbi:2OG-Fe(II) oxygenase family protein [Pseudoxanthomonas sp. J35]|uniref:2OG-Fe(II) oxygenase n=1 Tax=Pseudoxanthomonas sp. J35 TaxID=935852 RepID=UPI0004B6D9B9|nr:2OG-Fe(II) oxygenase family protein [Pseudoxanthomonas sp. J35]
MISNDLQLEPWRARLRAHGRVQIPGFLQEDAAARLHQCLRDEVPWEIAQRTGAELPPGLPREAAPGSGDDARLLQAATARARDGFEFYFDRYRMIDARREGRDPQLVLHAVLDFLNSPEFIAFARQLTGDAEIRMTSAIGVRYRHGHFLRSHSDHASDEDRAFAYVINLSHGWKPDWGGLLHFLDPTESRVIDTFTPLWNSLSLFRVPQPHEVSLVAPWAGCPRYSITGWLRRG